MLSSIRRHHIRIGLFLLVLALVVGTMGCVGEASQTAKYDLTIASGEGGSVTVPGEGTFECDSGRVVDLVAVPASGYQFDRWGGDVGTIANVNAASTTITMNGNYSITATFEETEGAYYALTVGVTGGGSTSPAAGQHTYGAGAVISISATPASGYHFVNWTGNVGTIANVNAASTTITMNDDYSIIANFEETEGTYYTLTLAVIGSGSTSPAMGQHTYAAGTVVPIIATPAAGQYFVNWTGNVGTIANVNAASTTITMAGNYSITANFEVAAPYTLTMAVAGAGSTSPAVGQHTYTAGTSVPITATPTGSYSFSHWAASAGSFDNASSAITTFTMPGQDVTVTANFVEGPPIPPDQYTLTMAVAGSGSTSPAVGPHTYAAGTVVPIVATAAGGFRFLNWVAAAGTFGSTTTSATTFTMPAQNVTVTANFVPVYSLTMAVAPGGSGTATDLTGASPYTAGTVVSIQAVPIAGYRFVNWTATPAGTFGTATAATTTFTMPAQAATVTAHFGLIPPSQYSLAISSTAGGSVTTPGEGTFTRNAGTAVSLVASPGTSYRFANWIGHVGTIADLRAASTAITMNGNYEITAVFAPRFMTAAGGYHTVGLRAAGTAVAVGYNGNGQCNVGGWTNIIQVVAGELHTVGLRSNGTVIAVGDNSKGQCNVGSWANIVQMSAGAYYTVGLRADGTVIATGDNSKGQCNVGSWANIVQISAGAYYTVGLRADGTVIATGDNSKGQCNVGGWTNIIQVSAGLYHSVGLKSDGTVVAAGDNGAGQSGVSGWTNVIQVSAGWLHTIGLKANGTVVAVGYNGYGQCNVGSWANIVQVSAGQRHTVGLRSNGTAAAVGYDATGQCNVGVWDLN
jgi:hypothetical protein